MKQQYSKYDILEVLWIDSHGGSGWKAPSEFDEFVKDATKKWLVKTVGYYLHEDKDFLRVAQAHDHANLVENSKGDNVDNYMAIAKKIIKEVNVLKYANKKERKIKTASRQSRNSRKAGKKTTKPR